MVKSGKRDIAEDISTILSMPESLLNEAIEEYKKQNEEFFANDGVTETKRQLILAGGTYEDMDEEIDALREFIKETKMRRQFDNSAQEEFMNVMVAHLEKVRNAIKAEGLFLPIRVYAEAGIYNGQQIKLPFYANIGDAGCDVIVQEDITIGPNETVIVPTGFKVAIPIGYEIQVRLRSSVALRTPLRIPNAPGTIDAGYRGEVGIIVWNSSDKPYTIKATTRLAQLVLNKVEKIEWRVIDDINNIDGSRETEGQHGFGSTGE